MRYLRAAGWHLLRGVPIVREERKVSVVGVALFACSASLRLVRLALLQTHSDVTFSYSIFKGQSQEMKQFRLHLSKSEMEINPLYLLCVQKLHCTVHTINRELAPLPGFRIRIRMDPH